MNEQDMSRSPDRMKLDLIRWRMEEAEAKAGEEYRALCREKPREYGEKPFCIRETTYRATFYKYLCEDVLWIISLADSQVPREWQQEKEKREKYAYAE